MRAGNDLVMPGCFGDWDNLTKELKEGTLDLADVKACIARLVLLFTLQCDQQRLQPMKSASSRQGL